MVWKPRRVITGHDSDGRSTILFDGPATAVQEMASMPGLALTDLWETTRSPADNNGSDDSVTRPVRLEPPRTGSIFRIVEFPPDANWRNNAEAGLAFSSIGAGAAHDDESSDPMMHTTATVDYIVVLQGEIHAIVDTGETLLRQGDVFVQRGTRHSWSVRGTKPCVIAAILVSANEL